MRRFSTVALSLFAVSSLAGCALILGGFTTDSNISPDGGGNDARADGTTDGGDGGGPKLLVCAVDGVPHKILNNPDASENPLGVHVINGNGDQRRIAYLLTSPKRRVEIDDVRNDGSNLVSVPFAFGQNIEYIGYNAFDGGFAFIGFDNNAATLSASFLLDKDQMPSSPAAIALNPPLPNSVSNFSTAIVPLDLNAGIFFVAVSFSVNNAQAQDVYAGSVKLSAGSPLPPLEKVQSFNARPDFSGIALDRAGHKAALLIGADKGLGEMQVLTVDFTAAPKGLGLRPLPGMSGSHVLGTFMAPSVPAPGTNGAAFLTGDLANQGVVMGYHSGTIADDKVSTFVVADMPALVKFDSIDDLAIDKATFEWRFFPVVGPQLVIAGRKTGTGDGVNLAWFDAKGSLRARSAGATALFPSEKVSGAGATFRSPPTAIFATLSVIWRTEAHDIMLADVTCK